MADSSGPSLFPVVLFTILAIPGVVRAEPPSVTSLSPAGVQRGQSVEVKAAGKLGTRPVEVWTSHAGLTVTVPEKGETITVEAADDVPVGVHFLRLHNAEGASALRPFVVGTLPELVEKEPNDRYGSGLALDPAATVGVVANGVLGKSGDVDCWRVPLEEGQMLVASMVAATELGSPMDAVLQVVSPRGFTLVQNDDARGNDPRIVYTAPRAATYTVRTFAFPSTPNSTIGFAGGSDYVYRLTLTTGPYVDHVVPLALSRTGHRKVTPIGWNLPNDDPVEIAIEDGDSIVRHLADELSPFAPLELPVVDHPSITESSVDGVLPVPVTVTGHIGEVSEVDEFSFEGRKGEPVSIRAESHSLRFPLDAALKVVDAAGKSLKTADDAKREDFDPVIAFTPPADGTYRVRIRDVYENAGPRYAYRLSILPRTPDFTVTLAADRFSVEVGKTLKIPVTIGRLDGFGEAIEVELVDPPVGVAVAAVISEAKGDTKGKVELEIVASAEAAGGWPLRVIGRAKRVRPATSPSGIGDQRTEHAWLTVTKPTD